MTRFQEAASHGQGELDTGINSRMVALCGKLVLHHYSATVFFNHGAELVWDFLFNRNNILEEIMKKLVIIILVISLFNYLACTTLNVATKESIEEEMNEGTLRSEMYIITKDNNRYHFGSWGYRIENDTLFGKGLKVNPNGEEPFEGKIAMDDISHFEVEEGDGMATMGLVLGIGALAALTVVLIGAITFGNSVESCSQKK